VSLGVYHREVKLSRTKLIKRSIGLHQKPSLADLAGGETESAEWAGTEQYSDLASSGQDN